MSYKAHNKRNNLVDYRLAVSSCLKLLIISLGLWQNFGSFDKLKIF